MKPISIFAIVTVSILASSCGAIIHDSSINVSSSLRQDKVVASTDLKKFQNKRDLKVVLRVPQMSGSITAGSLSKNIVILESQLNNKGIIVVDRGEMTTTLGESNESFTAIKDRTGIDLILEVVKFDYNADLYRVGYNKHENRMYSSRISSSDLFRKTFHETFTDVRALSADQYSTFVNGKTPKIYLDAFVPFVYFNLTAKLIDVETGNIVGIVDLYDFPYDISPMDPTIGVTTRYKKGTTTVLKVQDGEIRFDTNRLVPKLLDAFNKL